jgi:hypothetical protein
VNFFRSPSQKCWRAVPAVSRQEIEASCLRHTERIVRALAPRAIVVFGFKTFNALTAGEVVLQGRKRVLMKFGEVWGVPAYGVLHLTGARPSGDDLSRMAAFFSAR